MKDLYKHIGNIDCLNLIKLVSRHTEEDWNKYDFRQKRYHVHSQTTTLAILYDKFYSRNIAIKAKTNITATVPHSTNFVKLFHVFLWLSLSITTIFVLLYIWD